MIPKEAIAILEEYNAWRNGAEIPQPDPKVISQAIRVVVTYIVIAEREKEKQNEITVRPV